MTLRTITPDDLVTILAAHKRWRETAGAEGARADLAGADLAGANLAGAYLEDAYLERADLAGAINAPGKPDDAPSLAAPKIELLNCKVLAAVEGEAAIGKLDMSDWHADGSCGTTHCMFGWAIHLAGEPGYALEKQVGPFRAGAMIWRESTGRAPHAFAPQDRALRQLRERAAKELAAVEVAP